MSKVKYITKAFTTQKKIMNIFAMAKIFFMKTKNLIKDSFIINKIISASNGIMRSLKGVPPACLYLK